MFPNFEEKKTLINSYFYPSFNYCPLVWMFSRAKSLNKVGSLQKRPLRFLYDDYVSHRERLIFHSIQYRNGWLAASDLFGMFFFFKLLFGCPTANFGPLSRGQPHSPDVNHCVLHFRPEGHRSLVMRLGP